MRFAQFVFLILVSGCHTIIPDTKNDYKMVVTWGKPLRDGIELSIPWEECLQTCWNDTTCVLVYDTSPTCQLYRIEGIPSVQKLPPNSSRVAFRMLARSQTCSDPQLDPLLIRGTVQSDIERFGTYSLNEYIPYNITLENEVWTISQREPGFTCQPPLVPVRRGGMIWCMTVRSTGRCLDRSQAETDSMSQFNQPIAGPANEEEYEFLKKAAMSYITNPPPYSVPSGYSTLGFWIDGKRKPECASPNSFGATCVENEFDYADSNARPPFLQWLSGQPDALGRAANADCLYFLARTGAPAAIDDIQCTYSTYSPLRTCMLGYYGGRVLGPDTWK